MSLYYQDDYVTLYHGDSFEFMADMSDQSVDAVITDPPYDARTHSMARSNRAGYGSSQGGNRTFSGTSGVAFSHVGHEGQVAMFAEFGRITRRWVVSNLSTDTVFRFETEAPPPGLKLLRVGVWVKTNPMPIISADRPAMGWEAIAYLHRESEKPTWNGGGRAGNYVLPTSQGSGHPSQKPLAMVRDFVSRFSNHGDTVFDPFAGTGTTALAAVEEGRKVIAVESDERWCEFTAARLDQGVLDLASVGGD